MGTAGIERIGSLISRLAFSHCITPRNFLEFHFGIHGYKHIYAALSGIGRTASEIVAKLETLTHQQHLARLTLLPLGEVISTRELLRSNRVWCPQCYQRQRECGEVVYDKLLWAVEAVRVCVQHRVFLVDRCPDCAYVTGSKDLLTYPGYCPACARWLGSTDDALTIDELDVWTWEQWKADAVGELLHVVPSLPVKPNTEHLAAALRTILSQTRTLGTHFAVAAGLSARYFYQCMEGSHRLALQRLLRIAWSSGTLPIDLLTGRFTAGPVRVAPETRKMRYSRPVTRAGIEARWDDMERAARAALSRENPPSLGQLSEEFGVSRGCISGSLKRELREELTRRYRDAKATRRREQCERSRADVAALITELVANGVAPTRAYVAALLKERRIPLRTTEQMKAWCRELCAAVVQMP